MHIPVVCGPTASGKTGFSVALAKRLGGEVISADCMLVYRGLDIGTAKPTAEEMCGVPHHMIDIVSPTEKFSVSDYVAEALPICQKLLREGKLPVLCGGTGFYIRALLFERSNGGVGADEEVRSRYTSIAKEKGNEALHALLAEVDPESAAALHPNDVKRVVRALEIHALTGRKKSAQRDGEQPRFPYIAVAFDYPREELYARINKRVEEMLAAGLVYEVGGLLARGVAADCQCMQGIGYKEVVQYLKNEISYSTMCDMIKQNTRRYAKRQITYFKSFPGIVWLDPHAEDENLELVLRYVWEKSKV